MASSIIPPHHDASVALSQQLPRWMKLAIDRVVTIGGWVENPDLRKIDEIGSADLMPGSGHSPGGYVNVARIEVYGKPVKR